MSKLKFTILLLLGSLCNVFAQESWTEKDKAQYAANRSDSSTWNMKMLSMDISMADEIKDWPKPGISDYPSPVPKYSKADGYSGAFISSMAITINGKKITGYSVSYGVDPYRNHLIQKPSDEMINYFNIFILSDLEGEDYEIGETLSRNFPHHMSTGMQETSQGKVEWLHMSLAEGHNMAVVSQRYFDLDFGKTILVVPLKDGSIRLLQIQENIGSFSSEEWKQNELGKKFSERLESNKKVISFFNRNDRLVTVKK